MEPHCYLKPFKEKIGFSDFKKQARVLGVNGLKNRTEGKLSSLPPPQTRQNEGFGA
jgi:hypothetical protein